MIYKSVQNVEISVQNRPAWSSSNSVYFSLMYEEQDDVRYHMVGGVESEFARTTLVIVLNGTIQLRIVPETAGTAYLARLK